MSTDDLELDLPQQKPFSGQLDPDFDDSDDDDDDEKGVGGGWGDDALVSGDPAAIDRTWGHAVDFIVDAGLLEVRGVTTWA